MELRLAGAEDPEALVELAILLIEDLEDREEEAEALLREAIERGEEDGAIVLGSLLVEQEREEEAEEVLRAAVERGSVAAMIDLANLLSEYEEGDEEAEQLYRTALEHGDLDAENNLGVLLRDLGRTDEARELLKRAADRGDELAAENLAKLDGTADESAGGPTSEEAATAASMAYSVPHHVQDRRACRGGVRSRRGHPGRCRRLRRHRAQHHPVRPVRVRPAAGRAPTSRRACTTRSRRCFDQVTDADLMTQVQVRAVRGRRRTGRAGRRRSRARA